MPSPLIQKTSSLFSYSPQSLLSCLVLIKPPTLLPSFCPFSSSAAAQKPNWNSRTTLLVTNPTLLIMESCDSMAQLKQIQAHMTRTGLIFHLFPVSRVLSFCALADSGDIRHAHLLFAQISEPNVYICNTMIRGYCKAQFSTMAFSLFRRMIHERVEMDRRSFVFALKACEIIRGVEMGQSVHCRICKVGFDSDLVVQNGLAHFYVCAGCLTHAQQLFDECPERDVVSWTTMIDGYAQNSMCDEALRLFDLMLSSGIEPNDVTMITVLSACSQKGDVNLGKSLHEYIKRRNINCTLNLTNALLDMHVKCGRLETAEDIFSKMETKDVFSWTSMINGYAKNGELDLARKCFNEMPERNVVSWNAIIAGYSQNNHPKEALELFYYMENAGLVPIESTLVSVLSACAQSGCLDLGQRLHHDYIKKKRIQLSIILANAFIDMYSKCGSIDAAEKIFNELQERGLISWNSMIVSYASHGHADKALALFEQMQSNRVKPDDVTFVGILSACSHGGFVTQGREHFANMQRKFGIKPKVEHYACMIDLLGRVGLLEEAYALMTKMPMEPDEVAWGALLNACRMHGNVELGKLAADKLLHLNPKDSGIYMLLASLCANNERWVDARMVRSMMRERGIKKTPGRSCIEVEGLVHEFLAADESHPESKSIYEVLSEIFLLSESESSITNFPQIMSLHENFNSLVYGN
ncbi:pentatricopeptide repeat-containing protein At2g22410, mitochondrial-like [Diospyros lotus]|uniref:pentatricopeptide repeat-containing protein At2g22410, mitochondrial-like n=1 Tax=Diospyros lotus TaxID=55363 RepID=UPI00224DAD28|nr:pentatricopeptide repeat-containing protein At2g22410, mitochondrial-like [Diospyros lotus]